MGTRAARISTAYYTEISRAPCIEDPREERRLLRAWQLRGDIKARDAIIQTHLRFVVKQAHRRTKDLELVKDYIAAGNLGLLKAADKFDLKRKIRFLTYAGWWVLKEMSDLYYSTSSLVHVPAHRQKELRRNARAFSTAVCMRGPEDADVLEMNPGLPEGTVVTLDAAKDTPAHTDIEPEVAYGSVRLRSLLRAAVARLPVREQTVLNLYFGAKDDARNLVQIASIMGMCPERVRQIKLNGMRLLHDDLRDHVGLSADDAAVF